MRTKFFYHSITLKVPGLILEGNMDCTPQFVNFTSIPTSYIGVGSEVKLY